MNYDKNGWTDRDADWQTVIVTDKQGGTNPIGNRYGHQVEPFDLIYAYPEEGKGRRSMGRENGVESEKEVRLGKGRIYHPLRDPCPLH